MRQKGGLVIVTFLQVKGGVYQVDYLTSADQAIPDGLVSVSISGRTKTIIKSQFGDLELSTRDSIWDLLF